jgi:hypothetical protein
MSSGATQSSRTKGMDARTADWLFLAVLACAGLAVRILRASASGLWHDEGLFLFVADIPTIGGMIDFLRTHEAHPPLFYLAMRLWRWLVGPSIHAAQALTLLLGVAQIPAAYLVGTRMFSRRAGLIAAALVAFSPSLVYHSILIRPYSLLPLLALVSTYFLWSGLQGGGWRAWLGYVAVVLPLLYTHNWAWIFLATHWVAAWAWFVSFRPPIAAIRGWLAAQGALALGFAPWLPVFLEQARHGGHLPFRIDSLNHLNYAGSLLNSVLSPFFGKKATALLAVFLLAALVWSHRRRVLRGDPADARWAGVLLLASIPFLAWAIALYPSAKSNLIHARCLAITVPGFLVALAQVIATLSPPRRWALPALVVLGLVLVDLRAIVIRSRYVRSNAREMAAAVAAQAEPADLVVIAPDELASSFNLYFEPDNPQIDYPHEKRLGTVMFDRSVQRYADPQALRRIQARLDEAHRQGRRVWLITDRDRLSDNAPDPDCPLTVSQKEDLNRVIDIRTNQVRRYLISLYGPADVSAVPPDPRPIGGGTLGSETECICVYLFKPSRQAPVDAAGKQSKHSEGIAGPLGR